MLRAVRAAALGRRSVHHSSNSPAAQIDRFRSLIIEASSTNSKIDKERIIADYPDLRSLLERTYDPHLRNNVTSTGFNRWYSTHGAEDAGPDAPDSLEELLDSLSSREVTGNKAFQTVQAFLNKHDLHDEGELSPREVFWRIMDRNLKAGFSARTVHASAQWAKAIKADPIAPPPQGQALLGGLPTPSQTPVASLLPDKLQSFSPALGKTLLREDLYKIFAAARPGAMAGSWFASRKLDGVRVLCVVDVLQDGRIQNRCLSRSGREFSTLDVLRAGVTNKLGGWSGLQEIATDADRVATADGVAHRFVLDGELCVLRRATQTDATPAAEGTPEMVEDFQATVSWIRRKDFTIDNPTLFLLDVIPWSSFCGKTYSGKPFNERLKDVQAVTELFTGDPLAKQVVRRLQQVPVKDIEQVEGMMGVAADKGWEGIILRRDVPYEGKRTSNIYKYKEWLDAEYTVLSTDNSMQRLSIGGVFENRMALANVWIDHKGTPVSVGSGFTTAQRLRYGADPSLVVGKQITVEYFAESTAKDRNDEPSLRFPRVKRVWEEGEGRRDV